MWKEEGHQGVDGLLISWGRGWRRMARCPMCCGTMGTGITNERLFSATGLSFAIGSGLLTLDALRAVHVIRIHGLVLFLRSP